MRLYLDTNIIMDFLLGRYLPSRDLILRAKACAHELFISPLVLEELRRQGLSHESAMFVTRCGSKMIVLEPTAEDIVYAETLPTHFADALHYAVARRCDAIVTRNTKDFPFDNVLTPGDVK